MPTLLAWGYGDGDGTTMQRLYAGERAIDTEFGEVSVIAMEGGSLRIEGVDQDLKDEDGKTVATLLRVASRIRAKASRDPKPQREATGRPGGGQKGSLLSFLPAGAQPSPPPANPIAKNAKGLGKTVARPKPAAAQPAAKKAKATAVGAPSAKGTDKRKSPDAAAGTPVAAAAPPFESPQQLGEAWHGLIGYGERETDAAEVEKELAAHPQFLARVIATDLSVTASLGESTSFFFGPGKELLLVIAKRLAAESSATPGKKGAATEGAGEEMEEEEEVEEEMEVDEEASAAGVGSNGTQLGAEFAEVEEEGGGTATAAANKPAASGSLSFRQLDDKGKKEYKAGNYEKKKKLLQVLFVHTPPPPPLAQYSV